MLRKLPIQVFVASASIVSVIAASVAVIPRTEANASGCSGGSCVRVYGEGLYVNYVDGVVNVGNRRSVVGHMEIWGSGFHVNTSDKTYRDCNPQTGKCAALVRDTQRVHLNRNLPNNSKVCARFWRKAGSSYFDEDIACVTIER